ncbi:MAG: biopolymer transporter ExbD, partial [Anderseniella sp.]
VVFLLLLFFMLASVFHREGEIEIAALGTSTQEQPSRQPLFVRVHADGRYDVNGEPVDAAQVGSSIASTLAASSDLSGVVLQIRKGASTQIVVDSLTLLREAGVSPVSLAK